MRRSALGPVLFSTFTSDMAGGIQSTFPQLVDYTKLLTCLKGRIRAEGLGQSKEVSLCETPEVQQGQVQAPAPQLGQSSVLIQPENAGTEGLGGTGG